MAVIGGNRLGDAQRLAAGDDRDLVHRIGLGLIPGDQRVAAFMKGDHAPFRLAEHDLALGAQDHPVERLLEIVHRDRGPVGARGVQGGFVDQVGQVGADQPGRGAGDHIEVAIRVQGHAAGVDLDDG